LPNQSPNWSSSNRARPSPYSEPGQGRALCLQATRMYNRLAMRRTLLSAALLASLVLSSCRAQPSDLLFEYTGEEGLVRQVVALGQLAGSLTRPQPDTQPDLPVDHAGMNPFGINVFLDLEVEDWKRELSVQMIADAGFHWMRQEFRWEDIEIHGKGDYEDRRQAPARSAWDKYDSIVDLAEQYGLELVVRLSNPPAWTRALTDTIGSTAPPDNLADWGDFVETVVSRYQGRVRYYQLWNEPNIYPEWGERPVDPEEYTQLLCEGYARAKEADPDAVIISGALAQTVELNPGPGPGTGVNDLVFLQRMYDSGAGACFDVMSVNDYLLQSGPSDRRMRPLAVNFSRPVLTRDLMVANGDGHKPVWISEMSANAVPADPSITGRGVYGEWTLEEQARYTVQAYDYASSEWPWLGLTNYWFFKRADESEKGQAWYYFRMVEPDFTPLPIYGAIQYYIAGYRPTLHRGYHQEDHWAIDYEGAWHEVEDEAAVLGAYRRATELGASLSLRFAGGTISLVPGPRAGVIEVSADREEPRLISLEGSPVRLAKASSTEPVEVRIVVVSGDVSVDGFIVRPAPEWWGWALAGLGLAAGLTLVVWQARRRSTRPGRDDWPPAEADS
jgi:hypothetical protein